MDVSRPMHLRIFALMAILAAVLAGGALTATALRAY